VAAGVAIAADWAMLLRAASGIGLIGAAALAWFMADVMRHVFRASAS
jgi:hypothetical protein